MIADSFRLYRGHVFFSRQLHVLLLSMVAAAAAAVAVLSICVDAVG